MRFAQHAATAPPRARLITANLRLVVKIAQEYRRAHQNLLDLIQEGNIGLIQAVQKYDPYRGVKLSSYAAWWIRAYILKFILTNWRLVKIGTTQAQRKLFFNLRKEREKLEKLGFEVEAAHLAAALDVTEHEVIEMERRLGASETSLDAPVRGDERRRAHAGRLRARGAGVRARRAGRGGRVPELLRDKLEAFGADAAGPRAATSSASACSPTSRRRCRRSASATASPASARARSRSGSRRSCGSTWRPSSATRSSTSPAAGARSEARPAPGHADVVATPLGNLERPVAARRRACCARPT